MLRRCHWVAEYRERADQISSMDWILRKHPVRENDHPLENDRQSEV
jgi:hypothetical protein